MILNRIALIDIAKGIGILLVVLGHQIDYFHAPMPGVYPYIYLFHVPLFFFLSGMFFREKEDLWTCFRKKFMRLFVPYLLANIFFFLVEMVRVWKLGAAYDGDLGWRDLWLACAGLWPVLSMLSRPTWFILVLFRITLIYKLIQMLAGGRKWIMAVLCAAIGIAGAIWAPGEYMLGQTMVALPFLCLGHICGAGIMEDKRVFGTAVSAVGALAALPLLYLISVHQQTNITVNVYDNAALMFAGALLGIIAVLWLSKLIEWLPDTTKLLSFVGRYTLSILIWHIFIMKVLFTAAEYAGWENSPVTYIAAFIVAVALPCAMSMIYAKIKDKIWSR